jgi:hypothetical protein
MSKLRNRIEALQASATSAAVLEACNEAILRIEPNKSTEGDILESLLENLSKVDDEAAKQFVSMNVVEKRVQSLNDLGVKKSFSTIAESEIAKHPAFSYMFEKLQASANSPEWMVIESVIAALSPFNWDSTVNECLKNLTANADKHREEITIYKIVENLKNSTSNYLLPGVSTLLENYLDTRSSADRVKLMEKTSQFIFDPHMKNLYNFLGESERTFHIATIDNSCSVNRVYSPVFLGEGFELFAASGKIYRKEGEVITVANEEEINSLPANFLAVSDVLGKENVVVAEGTVKIYSGDKKVEISESDVKINGKVVDTADIHKVYLNAGVFKMTERENINHIYTIKENWDSLCEMDFAKVITSKAEPHKTMTVFFIGENIFLNKTNRLMNENVFYADCNATQTKNLVMEYMKFDISSTFSSLLTEETKAIKESNSLKAEMVTAITHLNEQKAKLENLPKEISENAEVKELIAAIDEEINFLKSEYSKVDSAERSTTKVDEGMGFNVGDEAELGKKK